MSLKLGASWDPALAVRGILSLSMAPTFQASWFDPRLCLAAPTEVCELYLSEILHQRERNGLQMFDIPPKPERGTHNWSDHTGVLIFVFRLSQIHPQGQLALSSNSHSCSCSCLLSHKLVIEWTKTFTLQPKQMFEKIFFPLDLFLE